MLKIIKERQFIIPALSATDKDGNPMHPEIVIYQTTDHLIIQGTRGGIGVELKEQGVALFLALAEVTTGLPGHAILAALSKAIEDGAGGEPTEENHPGAGGEEDLGHQADEGQPERGTGPLLSRPR